MIRMCEIQEVSRALRPDHIGHQISTNYLNKIGFSEILEMMLRPYPNQILRLLDTIQCFGIEVEFQNCSKSCSM
jgi:hypothetical protein